ncbi:MAG: oligosaccharide flippase family protein [Bacteroidales bacterium]|nr:oligosaccharide flippase family protein [Bacteroidales bacterium]
MQIRKIINKYSKNKLAKGSAIYLSIKVIAMVFGYANIIIITKYFGTSALGIFSYIISILTIFGTFATLGIQMTTLRFISKFKAKKEFGKIKSYYFQALKIIFVPGIIFSLLFFFFSDFIAGEIFNKPDNASYLKLFAFILIPISIRRINGQFVRAYKKIGQFGFIDLFYTPITVFILIGIIIFTNNRAEGTPITAHFVSLFIMFVLSIIFILLLKNWKSTKITEKVESREIFKMAVPMLMVVISGAIIKWSDKIILGYYVSNAQIGVYHAMYRTAVLLGIVLLAVNSGIAPHFSELFELKKIDELKKLVHKTTKTISIITFSLFVVMIIFSKFIVNFLLDTDIETGLTVFYILTVSQLVSAWSGPVGIFLMMSGNERINQNTSLILAIVFIILNIILVYFLGIIGAAISVTGIMVLRNMIYVIIVKRKYDILFLYIPKSIKKVLNIN